VPVVYTPIDGEVVDPTGLHLPRAVDCARAVGAAKSLTQLVECRANGDVEVVVFDVDVERPQHPVNDVHRVERIAARVSRADDSYPEALALRDDFPAVPHLNLRDEAKPRNLCLYDRPWDEVRPGWTGASFLDRVRWWLEQTARGELHADDQPLEPLMFSHGYDLVVSSRFGLEDGPKTEFVRVVLVDGKHGRVLVGDSLGNLRRGGLPSAVIHIDTPPKTHGVIQRTPGTIRELAALVDDAGFRLVPALREALRALPEKLTSDADLRRLVKPTFVLALPKTRNPGGPVEWTEVKGFLCLDHLEAVGVGVGAWAVEGSILGRLLGDQSRFDGSDVKVAVVNVQRQLTWERAAQYSGRRHSDARKIVAVGVGALGSQVVMNLARSGFGRWSLVDDDSFVPHNAVRHALEGGFPLGRNKAECVALYMNSVADDEPIAEGIPSNFLRPGDHSARVNGALSEADLMLDMSASVPVARAMAEREVAARSISVFLSPNGRDLVLLAEDQGRSIRLDDLEMMYYGETATRKDLREHLAPAEGRARYGASCRDVSVSISQAAVATCAGIAAGAVGQAVQRESASARVWRTDPETLAVCAVELDVHHFVKQVQHGWRVCVSRKLLDNVVAWRRDRLPNETGGILLGGIDHDRRCMHIVLALPSPPDSEEWPTMYIRGVRGLQRAREQIVEATAGNLDYLGEWHSHPPGSLTAPSGDDRTVFRWIDELAVADGRPPVMLIVGEADARVFVGRLEEELPEPICLSL
jgi:proteasome lid subunit RPN8/RPN11